MTYSLTFHQIDKSNQKEASYDLGGNSKTHNWSPKLVFRYFNMNNANAHAYYKRLVDLYTPNRRLVGMREGHKEMVHAWCQRGETMRKHKAEHPSIFRDLTKVFDLGRGRKIRSDAKGIVASAAGRQRNLVIACLGKLRMKQRKSPWRQHQSLPTLQRGYCCWEGCPGIAAGKEKGNKRVRSHRTAMRCEECSAAKGKDVFLCNDVKFGALVMCHTAYHNKHHNKQDG